LSGCNLLQRLDASGNCLDSFPAALHLPLLQQLDLSSNCFTAWPSLPPLPHLQQFSVADNQIVQLRRLDGYLQLQTLDVAFNQITDLQHSLACLAGMPCLQQLQLHDNPCCNITVPEWQQQQGLGHAGNEAESSAAWYRQQVAAVLPWLRQLDRDELYVGPSNQQLQQLPWQQQQQQQQQAGGGSACRSLTQAAAIGKVVASNAVLGVELLRQLRKGSVSVGQPVQQAANETPAGEQQLAAGYAAAGCRSSSRPLQQLGYGCSADMAAATAATWLPSLTAAASATAGAAPACWPNLQGQVGGQVLGQLQQHLQLAGSHTAQEAAGSPTRCSSWLQQAEEQWSYSTRAMLVFHQAQQQQHQQKGSLLQPLKTAEHPNNQTPHAFGAMHSMAAAAAKQAAEDPNPLMCLQHKNLQELSFQPPIQHQQQLKQHPEYAAQQAAVLSNAAAHLQASWRSRCVRLQYNKQLQQHLQQQELAAAAVCLQSMWRGWRARQLAVLMRERQQQQQLLGHSAARHAAAVRIQAAVRGFGVRRRLKAALAAAGASGRCKGLGAEASDWGNEFEGVTDDFVTMSPVLLQELMQPEVHSSSSSSSSWVLYAGQSSSSSSSSQVAGDKAGYTVLAAATSSSFAATQGAAISAQVMAQPAPVVDQVVAQSSSACSVNGNDQLMPGSEASAAAAVGSGGAAAARYEAKLQQLMQEWGFTDRATAEAYYRCAECREEYTQQFGALAVLCMVIQGPACPGVHYFCR
jgi:hypothetical protein